MKTPCYIFLFVASFIRLCHGDPCQHIICKNPSHECRAVRICDVTGSCDTALSACGPKVESDERPESCVHGQPVVDISGVEVACGADDKLCPFGFHCHHQLCCPTSDTPQGLPECDEEENRNPQLFPSNSTLDLCIDHCQSDADCQGDGQVCCINDCSQRCESGHQTTSALSLSRPPTNTTAQSLTSDAYNPTPSTSHPTIPSPSYRDELKTSNSSTKRTVSSGPRESIDVAAVQTNPLPVPRESRSGKGPVRAPSLNGGMVVTPPVDKGVEPRDADVSNDLDNPERSHPQKAGQCPSQPKLTICGQPPCVVDEDCPGPTKCCATHCGRICVTPKETTSRLNKLRPNIFRDIGFGQPRQFEQSKDPTNSEVFGSSFRNYGLDFALRGPDGLPQNNVPAKSFGFPPEESYAGLYRHKDGPLYSYGFRPSASRTIGSSLLNKYESNSPAKNVNTKNNLGVKQARSYDDDNSLLGYKLAFSNNPRPFAGNRGHSRETPSTVGSPSFAVGSLPASAGRANNLRSFPGYGPNGFSDSTSGLNYGRLDPGSFGGIDKKDYEKLGLVYPTSVAGDTS